MPDDPQQNGALSAEDILPAEFQILEKLGSGGSGLVVKAMHRALGQLVAIKLLRSDAGQSDGKDMQRFQKEVKAIANLNHGNIVKVLQVGVAKDSTPFIVYEYLDGRSLEAQIVETGKIAPSVLSAIVQQVCDALSYVHANGIVHRDIKPGNIMLLKPQESNGVEVKLIDFGLARAFNSDADSSSAKQETTTTSNNQAGSPLYMSPEQCSGKIADQRSDIYSLACVIYHCLSGKAPFQGESPYHLFYQHVNEKPPLPDLAFPKALNDTLLKAMAKSPTERHQTIENFRNDIMRSLKEFSKNEKSGSRTGFLIAVSLLSVLAAAFGGTLMPAAKLPKHDDTTSNKKVVSAPRHVRVGHSPEEKLRLICHEDDDMELARDPDRAQKTIKALNALLPELTNNKILDYIACDLKSQLYRNINVVDKAEEENKRMLEICQNKKDYRSLEVNPFSVLSQIAFMQGRIADADKFASLSIKSYIAFQNDDSNSAVIIPSFYKPYPGVRSFSCSYCILSNIAYSQHKYMEALDLAKQASILQPPWSGNQAGRPILFQVKNFLAMKQDAKAIELLNQAFQGGFELEDALEDGKSASSLLDAGFDPCDFLVTVREAAEVFSYYGSVKEARILFSYVLAHKRQVPSEQVSRCLEGLSNLNKGTKPFIR